jgi:hypothetical protein
MATDTKIDADPFMSRNSGNKTSGVHTDTTRNVSVSAEREKRKTGSGADDSHAYSAARQSVLSGVV